MIKPIESPLECFGVEHDFASEICQKCEHRARCQEFMGYRLNRVAVPFALFDLIPDTIQYRTAERDVDERDIEAIYNEMYRLIFGENARSSIGKFKARIIELAEEAQCSIPMFILTVMFAHDFAYPGKTFTAGILADNRALGRVKLYADACRAKYASFDISSLSKLTHVNLAQLDLKRRMLDSEVKAGRWIIEYKLTNAGAAWPQVFQALEKELDPNWLAIEPHYEEILIAYSKRLDVSGDQETRHIALETFARLKKHKHQAIANFRARESIMPEAIRKVLGELRYDARDFEIDREPVKDALKVWNRLGLAIQHLECLLFVRDGSGLFR